MTVHAASVEYHAAVLSTWEVQDTTKTFIHHDRPALDVHSNDVFAKLISAQFILVPQDEWNTMPLTFGSAEVAIDGDHYTIMDNGTPTIHNGSIDAYGSTI